MKTQIKRTLLLLFIAIITAAAAVMVIMTTTGSDYDAELAAASSQDAQLTALAAENGGIKQVVAGELHTMVLFNNGKLYGTGYNYYGQLGLGDTTNRTSFTLVESLSDKNITSIACGANYTMAVIGGNLYATGNNTYGQLGLGNNTNQKTFTIVPGMNNVTSLVCGYGCTMVMVGGRLYATGDNYGGQLGLGDTRNRTSFENVEFMNDKYPKTIVPAGNHTMILTRSGQLYCVGENTKGQLGLGDTTNRTSFTLVEFMKDKFITSVVCGEYYSMVVADGQLYGTGENTYGQLGLGDVVNQKSFRPVPSMQYKHVTSVMCSRYNTLVIADEQLYATGRNYYGELGLGDTTQRNRFENVTDMKDKQITSVANGTYCIMVVVDGQLYGTGRNTYGQLGLGNETDRNTFTKSPLNYTINYNGNGGEIMEGSVTSQDVQYHIPTPLLDNPFVLDGSKFVGWATSSGNANNGVVTYTDKQAVTYLAEIGKSTTLYAVWQPEAPEISLDASLNEMVYDGHSEISLTANTQYSYMTYTYKWLYKGEGATTFSTVSGATGKTLKLKEVKQSGTYKVEVTAKYQSKSAKATSAEQQVKISKANVSPTLSIDDWTYGTLSDQVPKPRIANNIGGGAVTYYYEGTPYGEEEGSYKSTTTAPTQAGEYTLSVKIAATDNTYAYETIWGEECAFTIARAERKPTVKFPEGLTYTGSAIADPVVTNVFESPDITLLYSGTSNGGKPYGSDTPPTDAGTYTVTVNISETNNYKALTYTQEFTIARAKPDVKISINNWTYENKPNDPVISGNYEYIEEVICTYSGTSNGGTEYTDLPEAPTDAGKYTVRAHLDAKDNYEEVDVKQVFDILRKSQGAPTVSLEGWKYGETPDAISPVVKGNESGGEVSYSYEVKNNDAYVAYNGDIAKAPAGMYRITAVIGQTGNYNSVSSLGYVFTIVKGTQAPTVTLRDRWIYGNTLVDPDVKEVKDGAAVSYEYSGIPYNGSDFVTGGTKPTHAGAYNVKVTIAETANYEKYTVDHKFTIDRKVVYAPWIESKQYTGAKLTAAVTALSGVYKVTQNNGGTDRGSYPVVITLDDPYNYIWEEGLSGISGTLNENLTLTFYITATGNSWKTSPVIGTENKVTYGDNITYTAVAASGKVVVTYWNTDGTKIAGEPTQAGTYKAKFTVAASDSYAGLSREVEFTITKRNITVTVDHMSSVYGMPLVEFTYSVEGLAYDDTKEDLNVKLTKVSGDTAMRYGYTGTWDNANYAVTFKSGSYLIEQATYNMDGVTFNDLTVTYDGNAHSIVITGDLPEGVRVVYWYNAQTNAGTYKVKAQFKGDEVNYKAIEDMTAELTIEKADYDMSGVTFKDTEITYDGNAHDLKVTGTLPTGKDGIKVTVTYSNGTVTDVADGTVTITATYATTSTNYNVPAAQTATLKIVAKELTEGMFDVGDGPYIYDGNQKTPDLKVSKNEPNLQTVNYEYAYGENVNAGEGTITVTGSGNYSGSIVLKFVIEKATFTSTVTIEGWKYNGKVKTPVVENNVSGGECMYVYSGTSNDGTPYESSRVPSKAGNYKVTVVVSETDNYTSTTATSAEFVIERGVIKPKITIENWTYGDDPSVPVLVGNDGNGKVTLTYNGTGYNGTEYLERYNDVVAPDVTFGAGSGYTLEAVISQTDDYAAATVRVNFEIYRKQISAPEIKPVISNGYLQKADVSATDNYTVSKNAGGYEGGAYDVILALKDPDNTEWSEGNVSGDKNELLTLKFRIIGNANSWTTEPSVPNFMYGDEITLDYAAAFGNETVTITYYDKEGNRLESAPTAAGHYTVRFTVEGTIDYTGLDTEIEFDILPKEVTVTIGDKGHVYGEPEVELAWSTAEGSIEEGDDLNVTLSREQGTNAGTYTIKGTWNNGNYAVTFVEGKYTITKAKYDMNNVEFAGDVVMYDGNAHSLEVTGLPAGVSVTYKNNDKTNAGEYEVTATFTAADTTNYEALATSELTATLTIEKAKYAMDNVAFAGKTVTYNGIVHSLEVTGLPAGVSVTYKNNDKTNAGEYEVTATFTGDANHEAIGDMKATLTIAKAKYVMGGVEFADKKVTYDGKEHRIEVTGLPAGVSVTYTNNGQTNAGEYEVTATFEAADTENYEALETSELTAVLNIEKAKYNTDDLKFAGKTVTYNGETHSLYVEGLPGDVSVTYIGNDKRNAGEYEVTAVFTGDANYETIGKMSATLKIGKAKYDVSGVEFAGKEVTYNGETHSLYVDGLPAGVSVKYVGNDKRNAGTYEVTAVFTVDENHEAIATKSATLTINKAKYQVPTFADMTVTYDGESHSLKVTGVPYGVTVEYEGNGKKEAGTYTVTAKFTCDANYEAIGDLTATLTIEAEPEKGGCGSVVLDGVTIAGIAISVLAFASFLAVRKAKSKKK